MSQTPDYPDSVTADAVFQQTYEALVAFTGEDNVSMEQVNVELLKMLCDGKAFDGETFAAALCLPHFRDYADVTDHGGALPEAIRTFLLGYHDLDQVRAGPADMLDRICGNDRATAHIRLSEYAITLRDKRTTIVNDNDQEDFFKTSALTTALLNNIRRREVWNYASPDLLMLVVDEARAAHAELPTLDSDLFSDLPKTTANLGRAIDEIEPFVRQAKAERDMAVAATEALARARIERPQDFVFPHPSSAYERLKNGASKRFKL